MRKGSIKNNRINEEVAHVLGSLIRSELTDPRIDSMTSVTAAEVAPDLLTAKIYVSVLGDEQSQKDTLLGLQSAGGYLRRRLAHIVNLRHTPELIFVMDQSIEHGVQMIHEIDAVIEADERSHADRADTKPMENGEADDEEEEAAGEADEETDEA